MTATSWLRTGSRNRHSRPITTPTAVNTTMPVASARRPPTRAWTRRTAGARTTAKNAAMEIQAMTSTVINTTWSIT